MRSSQDKKHWGKNKKRFFFLTHDIVVFSLPSHLHIFPELSAALSLLLIFFL